LAPEAVDDTTNEISIIPQVLEGLVLQGRVVTIDAMANPILQHVEGLAHNHMKLLKSLV
jgi:hypothetical protein